MLDMVSSTIAQRYEWSKKMGEIYQDFSSSFIIQPTDWLSNPARGPRGTQADLNGRNPSTA